MKNTTQILQLTYISYCVSYYILVSSFVTQYGVMGNIPFEKKVKVTIFWRKYKKIECVISCFNCSIYFDNYTTLLRLRNIYDSMCDSIFLVTNIFRKNNWIFYPNVLYIMQLYVSNFSHTSRLILRTITQKRE